MKHIRNWYIVAPIVILFSVSIYFIFQSSSQVRFWADDFCSSVLLRDNGFWKSQIIWWNGWTGRYSYIALLDLTELFGLKGAQVLPVIQYVLFTIPLVLILSFSLPVALLLSVIFLINSPNIIQSFYWMTGSLNYFAPFVFLNFYLLLLFLKNKKIFPFLSFFIMFFASGFSESFAVACVLFLSLLFIVFYKKNKNAILVSGILGTIISIGVMYLSPGNAVRSSLVTHPDGILDLLSKTFYYSKWYLTHLIYIKPFVISILIIIAGSFAILDRKIKYFVYPKLIAFVSSIFIPVITVLIVGFTYQAMNLEPPERVMTIVNYMIIFATLIFSVSVFQIFNRYINPFLAKVMFSVLIILLSFQVRYHWQKVYDELKVSANSPTYVAVGKLDGLTDNNGWVASCIAGYYNLDKLEYK